MLQPISQSIDLGNVQATRIAVDQSGQYAALSSALELTVLSFARPSQTYRFPLNLKHDPVGLKWHPNDTNHLAVIRHNRCELLFWNATKMQLNSTCTLGGYVRPITSFDWSPVAPYLLVTSSADQFRAICIWDLRDLSRPVHAIESLSDPSIVKWNKLSNHYFASAHRSGIRLWDLRANISEPYLMDRCALSKTQTPPTILDFDWSPIVDHELAMVTDEGLLAVWHTKQPNCPQLQIGPTDVRFVRVFYGPSGEQILTLPDKVGWPKHGLGVWNAHDFQKVAPRLWRFDGSQSVSNHPVPSDPVVTDVAWRTCVTGSRESMQLNFAEETEECFKPEVEFASNGSDNNNPQTDLVTLSADRTLRIYPIHFAFVYGAKPSEDVPVDSTDSSREKHSGAGGAVSDSFASFVAHNAPTITTGRRQPGNMSGFNRHKHLDGQQQASKVDDSVSRPPLTSTDFGKMGGTKQNDAYRLLEQELSLLSPRAGQYKLEETDLINRNVKLQLWYCRRQHYHQHTICSAVAGVRDRRPSAEMEDLDSLLLLPSEIPSTLDGSVRVDHQWRTTVERSKSFGDLEFLSGDEWQPQNPSPVSRQRLPAGINSHTKQFRIESPIPLAGTVTLCVNFPLTYPSSTPIFSVLEHRPCLPKEVIERLYQVLQLTAKDLAQMSRGCMDPCIRKAIDLLQNISPAGLSTPSGQMQAASYELDALRSTLLEDVDGLFSRPGSHTWKQLDTENKHRSCTPFPRTSGVHFTPQGLLVTFGLRCSLTALCTSLRCHASNLPDASANDRTPRTYADFCRMRHLTLQIDHVTNNGREPIPSVSKSEKQQMEAEQYDRLLDDQVFDSVDLIYMQLEPNILSQSVLAPDASSAKVIPTSDAADLRVGNPGPIRRLHEYYRSIVQLYDLSAWIMHKKLTRTYSLNSDDVQQMCSHNYLVAMETGRKDLLRFWQYAVVLSASMVKFSRGNCGIPPLPAHPVGKWMFNEWLSYFLRLHDVQHLTMAILVLQGLDALYGAHLRSPPASRISTFEYTQTENFLASPSKQFVSDDTYTDRDRTNSENDASPMMATVSFNLDMSDELPEGLTPINESHTNNFTGAPFPDRPFQPHLPWRDYVTSCWRFVSADDLPCFAHYISVYANILHCMGKFLHHARLLRSWTRGLSFQMHGLHDRRTSSIASFKQWPYHGGTVLLLPTCPNCDSPTEPAESDDFGVTRIQCADCLQSFHVSSGVHSARDILTMNTRPTPSLQCSVCRTQAKGLVFICPLCYHGGHVDHLMQWFARVELTKCALQCPSLDCTCCCVSVPSSKTILQT